MKVELTKGEIEKIIEVLSQYNSKNVLAFDIEEYRNHFFNEENESLFDNIMETQALISKFELAKEMSIYL